MLESMTAMQFSEWLAFFKIRSEMEKGDLPGSGYGKSKEEQNRMSGDILRAMTGYQRRRDRVKSK